MAGDAGLRDLERAAVTGGWPERLALATALHRLGRGCPTAPHSGDELRRTHRRTSEFGQRPGEAPDGCPHEATWIEMFEGSCGATLNDRLERCARCGVVVASIWTPGKAATSNVVVRERTRAPEILAEQKVRSDRARRAAVTRKANYQARRERVS